MTMSTGADSSGEGAGARLVRRAWWALAARGVLAIVIGIVALTRPGLTMAVFLGMLSLYLVCDGVFTIVSAFHSSSRSRGRTFWPYLLEGLVSFGVGILGLARPGPLAAILLVLVAVRALVVGVVEIGTGISARRARGTSGFLLGLAGVASILFGLVFLFRPSAGVLVLAWTFGIYALAFGLLLDVEAIHARSLERRLRHQAV